MFREGVQAPYVVVIATDHFQDLLVLEAIRSITESRCSGERWLYRADIVIVLCPASS